MKKYIITLLIGFLFFSCEKMEFIEEDPNSDFILLDINEESLEAIINGAYEPLTRSRGRLWESVYSTFLDQCTEYSYSRLSLFNDIALYDFNLLSAGFNGTMWTSFYESIGRANFIIDNLATNTALSEPVKNAAIGEARFIRAICYFSLVRTYGSVPLRTSPIENANEIELESSSIDAIYLQIVEDFIFAETTLPEVVDSGKEGRATQGAAKVALADVYLTLGNFSDARNKAKEVIDNKDTYGYELVSSLETLFSPTLPTNSEEVFALKFAQLAGQGSFLPAYAADSRANQAGIASNGNRFIHTYNTSPFISEWDTEDLRRNFNLYNEIEIDGEVLPADIPTAASNTINGDFYYGKYQDPDSPASTGAGNDFYLYRYADALLIFAEADNQLNGPTADAYEAVNQIRRRGYGVDINTPSAIADFPAGLSQTEFDDLIFRERGYEFFFECKRWFDLKRTGRWESFALAAGKPAPQSDYWPLPPVELVNNPSAGN
ncbi:RagB/SusD family nutrient uptake outer membrane protein [Croceitalea sp. MTPC9]|uniref:RagB/SusD family nutrient uptake outer membrane protein n=1 Tax=unclassified Croceitalea TaxID=2632280 RepID=UPI002B39626B|nr:RagB/SusD family nutrient uptake outer membrane protein [Croceitalea sp. MTPC6]GMN16148.1 RagB/SusD family nutrient uptake outer membrane protein [Croceitalea sp. MTPC9]